MPGLTVNTSPTSQNTERSSRSVSPTRPQYSPITPTLAAARLATGTNSNHDAPTQPSQQRQTYTHSQLPQTSIAQPPPIPIAFDENSDALALKSAISILQLQARNATRDIQTLQQIKEKAVADPLAFQRAVQNGDIKSSGDTLFNPSQASSDDDEDEQEDEAEGRMSVDGKATKKDTHWAKLPTPQNVVRCPPINWTQYAVVGESLNKMHMDQQARPTGGTPQRLGIDGQYHPGMEGNIAGRQGEAKIAAAYQPGKDKIEKMGTRKGGKR